MLPGFNHNIKYQDRVYHIQTEDSGVRLAHVTSLLFIGGNVIASIKTEYGELRAETDLKVRVLQLMQTQHKAMLRALVSGRYDAEIVARSHNAATLNGPAPINIEAGAQNRASQIVTPLGINEPASAAPKTPRGPAATPIARTSHSQTETARANMSAEGATSAKATPVKKSETKEKKSANHGENSIESLAPMLMQPAGSLPTNATPPTNKQRGAPPRAATQSTPSGSTPASSPTDVIEGEQLRHAFAENEKAVDESIFGNLISPKSLDEVILSYLANNKSSDK